MSTICPTCGLNRGMTDARRLQVVEDTVFLLEAGLSEDEAMFRAGYTHRESWVRCLRRAGMAPIPNGVHRINAPSILTRLREAGLA